MDVIQRVVWQRGRACNISFSGFSLALTAFSRLLLGSISYKCMTAAFQNSSLGPLRINFNRISLKGNNNVYSYACCKEHRVSYFLFILVNYFANKM